MNRGMRLTGEAAHRLGRGEVPPRARPVRYSLTRDGGSSHSRRPNHNLRRLNDWADVQDEGELTTKWVAARECRDGTPMDNCSLWRKTAIVALVGLVLLLLRRPAALAGHYLWAEDGAVFLSHAQQGRGAPLVGLLDQYAGQVWLAPRLGAEAAVLFPGQSWPLAAYLIACIAVVCSCAVVLQRRAVETFGPLRARAALFFALLAAPLMWEVQGNLTNIHVWLALAMVVILTVPAARTAWGRGADCVFLAIAGLTGLLGLLTLPAAGWGAWRFRDRTAYARLVVVAVACAVNVSLQWSVRQPQAGSPVDYLVSGGVLLVKRYSGGLFLAERGQVLLWETPGPSPLLIPAVLVLIGVGYLTLRDWRGPSPAWLACGLLWLGLGLSSVIQGTIGQVFDPFSIGRYLALLVLVTLLIIVRSITRGDRNTRLVGVGLAAILAVGTVAGFVLPLETPLGTARLDPDGVTAFGTCVQQTPGPCTLAILPDGWEMTVPGNQGTGPQP